MVYVEEVKVEEVSCSRLGNGVCREAIHNLIDDKVVACMCI